MRPNEIGSEGARGPPPSGASPGIHPAKESAQTFAKRTPPPVDRMNPQNMRPTAAFCQSASVKRNSGDGLADWHFVFGMHCITKQRVYFFCVRLQCTHLFLRKLGQRRVGKDIHHLRRMALARLEKANRLGSLPDLATPRPRRKTDCENSNLSFCTVVECASQHGGVIWLSLGISTQQSFDFRPKLGVDQ